MKTKPRDAAQPAGQPLRPKGNRAADGRGEPVQCAAVLEKLQVLGNPAAVAGMKPFGIRGATMYGVSVPALRSLAKQLGKHHLLAQELWDSGVHDARILAAFIDDPAAVTEEQMEQWVQDFDSWDVCDQVCCELFDKTPRAYQKAGEWSRREEEFVKRAGFVLGASCRAGRSSGVSN